MARREREEADRPARPVKKSGGPGVFGIALVLLVLAGVVALYLATSKKQPQAAAPAEQVDPFADLPPEPPPEKQAPHKADLQREQQAQEKKQE